MIEIIKKGALTTIQDSGRQNHRSAGINTSGVMDFISFRLLNILLKNNQNEAAIEMYFPAGTFLFEENCFFAITGADFSPYLNSEMLCNNKLHYAKKGDILVFKKKISGEIAYLGIQGGINTENWLGSKSINRTVDFPNLKNLYKFKMATNLFFKKYNFGISLNCFSAKFNTIEFVEGPEFEKLDEKARELVFNSNFTIQPNSNRMGINLKGPVLKLNVKTEMFSCGVDIGTVQLLPNGQMVILMADAQATGGYPRIGFVSKPAVAKIAQMSPSTEIQFKKITAFESWESERLVLRKLEIIEASLSLKENAIKD